MTGSPAASAPALAPETGTTSTESLGANTRKTIKTDPTAATAAPQRGPETRTRLGSDEPWSQSHEVNRTPLTLHQEMSAFDSEIKFCTSKRKFFGCM